MPLVFLFLVGLTADWKDWHYVRPISVPGPGLVSFLVPVRLYTHTQPGFGDLRIINQRGQEIPYVLQKRKLAAERHWRDTRLTLIPKGKDLDVVVDTVDENRLHNSLQLDIANTDYLARVTVSASDAPSGGWRTLIADAPVFRYRDQGMDGNQVIAYPNTYLRYLQLHITPSPLETEMSDAPAGEAGLRVAHVQVSYDERTDADWIPYEITSAPEHTDEARQSWWRADAGSSTLPITGIRFTIGNAEFHRPLKISLSADGQTWTLVATSDIYRSAGGGHPHERLVVPVPESTARYWRLAFYDSGLPPLDVARVELLGVPYHVVFQANDGLQYRLIYGNGSVLPPDYEMSRLVEPNAFIKASAAELGEEQIPVAEGRGRKFWFIVAGAAVGVVLLVLFVLSMLDGD